MHAGPVMGAGTEWKEVILLTALCTVTLAHVFNPQQMPNASTDGQSDLSKVTQLLSNRASMETWAERISNFNHNARLPLQKLQYFQGRQRVDRGKILAGASATEGLDYS